MKTGLRPTQGLWRAAQILANFTISFYHLRAAQDIWRAAISGEKMHLFQANLEVFKQGFKSGNT
jgi:hypothetical protein